MLPWDLPEFVASPMYQSMLQSDILQLSKDPETFLKAIEGCEDERYSPNSNAKMIVLLRKADKQLQTIRFQLVQQEGKIDVCVVSRMKCRMTTSGGTTSSASSSWSTTTNAQWKR